MSRPRSWVHANCPFEHWIEARRRERSPPCSIVSHSSKEIPGTIIRNSSNVPASSIRRVGAAAHASSDSGGDTIVRIEVDGCALTLPPLAAEPLPFPGVVGAQSLFRLLISLLEGSNGCGDRLRVQDKSA